jgi:hypothetical protein
MEHRWGLRRDVDQAVHVWAPGGVASPGRLRNISISGAFVVSALPVRLLGRVKLQARTSMGKGKAKLTAEAQVVRVQDDGFAVEWSEFAPPAVRAIIRDDRAQTLDRDEARFPSSNHA